jgi:hypothetical protein
MRSAFTDLRFPVLGTAEDEASGQGNAASSRRLRPWPRGWPTES